MGTFAGSSPAADDIAAAMAGEDINARPMPETPPEDPGTQPPPEGEQQPPEDQGQQSQQPPEGEQQQATETIRIGEREFDARMAEDIVGLVDWASSLTPEQSMRIQQALMAEEEAAAQQGQQPTPPEDPGTQTGESEAPQINYDALDEETAQALRAQQAELERLREMVQTETADIDQIRQYTQQQVVAQTQQQIVAAEQAVREEFIEKYKLSDEDYETLARTAGDLGIVDPFVNQLGLEEGFRRSLDTALYANEELREKLLRGEVERDVRQNLNASRKEAAAALGPQGGTNIPDQEPANLPVSARQRAMRQEIAQMLNGQ